MTVHAKPPRRSDRVLGLASLACFAALGLLGASSPPSDGPLIKAIRGDAALRDCACVVAATWLNESYPRVVVDERRFRRLSPSARVRFAAQALGIAERIYLEEFAAVDQYERIYIVDRRFNALLAYGSG